MYYIKRGKLYFAGFIGGETPSRCGMWTGCKRYAKAYKTRRGLTGAEPAAAAIVPRFDNIEIVEED